MLLAPVIFGTIVVGIAKMGNMKEVGRIGVRALLYFEWSRRSPSSSASSWST